MHKMYIYYYLKNLLFFEIILFNLLPYVVSRNVLKDEYHISNELDEINPDPSADHNDVYDDESIPPAPKLQGNFSHTTLQPSTSATNTANIIRGDKGTTSDVDYWIAGTYSYIFTFAQYTIIPLTIYYFR